MECVNEGLEVTYMFGNTGIGSVLDDRGLENKIIELIIERAKLQNKSHGVMDWTYEGRSYKIKVKEYDLFGEIAFRLTLKKSRRKRA